jgi:hypothetical protein
VIVCPVGSQRRHWGRPIVIGSVPIDRRQGDRSAAIVQCYGRRNRRALCNGDGHSQPEAGLNGGHGITRGRGTIAGQGGGDIPSRGPLRLNPSGPSVGALLYSYSLTLPSATAGARIWAIVWLSPLAISRPKRRRIVTASARVTDTRRRCQG